MVAIRFPRNYSLFRKKTPSLYNCNDLIILFCLSYYKKYQIMYSATFGGTDSRNLKAILRSPSKSRNINRNEKRRDSWTEMA